MRAVHLEVVLATREYRIVFEGPDAAAPGAWRSVQLNEVARRLAAGEPVSSNAVINENCSQCSLN